MRAPRYAPKSPMDAGATRSPIRCAATRFRRTAGPQPASRRRGDAGSHRGLPKCRVFTLRRRHQGAASLRRSERRAHVAGGYRVHGQSDAVPDQPPRAARRGRARRARLSPSIANATMRRCAAGDDHLRLDPDRFAVFSPEEEFDLALVALGDRVSARQISPTYLTRSSRIGRTSTSSG